MSTVSIPAQSRNKESPFPPPTKGLMRIYSMRFCPYAHVTLLVLQHKKIRYEVVNIDLNSKPDWFLERNPMGRVPVLEMDGKIVIGSIAASEWLDDRYPEPEMTPNDPKIKTRDRELVDDFGKLIHRVLMKLRKVNTEQDDTDEIHQEFKKYENTVAERGGLFFGGSSISLLDFYLWPYFERLPLIRQRERDELDITEDTDNFPCLVAWVAAMRELPAVKELHRDLYMYARYEESRRLGRPDYDYGLKKKTADGEDA